MRKLSAIIFTMALMVLSACDGPKTGGTTTTSAASGHDLSSIALTPDMSWHDSYLTGRHSSFGCDTCHTIPLTGKSGQPASLAVTGERKGICYQCHANNYNGTSFINHASYNIGTYCNSCHYSDSFKTHNRAGHSQYHQYITSSCETCHSNRYPSTHSNGRTAGCASCHEYSGGKWGFRSGAHTHTSGCATCHEGRKPASHSYFSSGSCENCHHYPAWLPASFSHEGLTTGCGTCHNGHYSPYSCTGCHTRGISWAFSHNSVSSANCTACHADGGGNGGHGGGGD